MSSSSGGTLKVRSAVISSSYTLVTVRIGLVTRVITTSREYTRVSLDSYLKGLVSLFSLSLSSPTKIEVYRDFLTKLKSTSAGRFSVNSSLKSTSKER